MVITENVQTHAKKTRASDRRDSIRLPRKIPDGGRGCCGNLWNDKDGMEHLPSLVIPHEPRVIPEWSMLRAKCRDLRTLMITENVKKHSKKHQPATQEIPKAAAQDARRCERLLRQPVE